MIEVEIVSHCWLYSRLWSYQAGSLILHPPGVQTKLTVFHCPEEDERTARAVEFFARAAADVPTLEIFGWPLPKGRLCRRAIGRNAAALATEAEIVWFADGDMQFRGDCLEKLLEIYPREEALCYPRIVLKCPHAHGDAMIEAMDEPKILDIEPEKFIPRVHRRAIGGVQIVKGDTARRMGYLPDSRRYQQPAGRWMQTREDPAFRRYVASGPGAPIQLPEVYRIRHSKYGRRHVGIEL